VVKCSKCGRPLKDPESIKLGMGPVCSGRSSTRKQAAKHPEDGTIPLSGRPVSLDDVPDGPGTKVYVGRRDSGGCQVIVQDGGRWRSLRHMVYHSPTGMTWGYGGSGPADLARSILADVAGLPVADALHQEFKFTVVANLPYEGWRLEEDRVRAWLRERLAREPRAS